MITEERLREIEDEYDRAAREPGGMFAEPRGPSVREFTREFRRLKAVCGRLKDVIVRGNAETAATLSEALGVPIPPNVGVTIADGFSSVPPSLTDGGIPVVEYAAVRSLVLMAARWIKDTQDQGDRA